MSSIRPDPFAEACGATAPIRLEVFWPDGSTTAAEFRKPFVLVGRDRRADLHVPDSRVSARHLYLQLLGGRLYGVRLTDRSTASSDGRSWDSGWLRPGDELTIGRVTLRVAATGGAAPQRSSRPAVRGGPDEAGQRDEPPADSPMEPTDERPSYAFEPLAGRSNPPRRFTYRQDLLLVGQSAPSEFRVHHPDVSRCHAAVVRTPAGLWVVDLISRLGLVVNGAHVTAAAVEEGDELTFGRIGVRVRIPAGDRPTNAAESLVPTAAAAPQAIEPILDQVAMLQKQTFEQFQELLAAMMQMVGGVLSEQRAFIQEELARLERLATTAPPSSQPPLPQPAPQKSLPARPAAERQPSPPPQPAPRPTAGRPQLDEVQLHAWLEQRLGAMNQQQSAVWERVVKMLKGG